MDSVLGLCYNFFLTTFALGFSAVRHDFLEWARGNGFASKMSQQARCPFGWLGSWGGATDVKPMQDSKICLV